MVTMYCDDVARFEVGPMRPTSTNFRPTTTSRRLTAPAGTRISDATVIRRSVILAEFLFRTNLAQGTSAYKIASNCTRACEAVFVKPNFITLAGLKLVADRFEAKFHYAIWFEPSSNQLA